MNFTINGDKFNVDKKWVERMMQHQLPDPIRQYYIKVNDVRYPLNQVLEYITGLTRVECKTVYSVPILHRIGYKIHQI